jgi:glycosyltransferase involved in cell wall biosynthesis
VASNQWSVVSDGDWKVVTVSKLGGPLLRWWRYAKALRAHAADADIVCAFSSVSCGVPLWMARLKRPKKILRLGGDFFWERYTDAGGMLGLRDWYQSFHYSLLATHWFMQWLLRTFDHIVFSTIFQKELYEKHYKYLPPHSVVENSLSEITPSFHEKNDPFRLLYMGRFVGFKNLKALIKAISYLKGVSLDLFGEGPLQIELERLVETLGLYGVVKFHPSLGGIEKREVMNSHDLLVIPSITEISPNVALEARSVGLPVLLTKETGLSGVLATGMMLRSLRDPGEIARAIQEAMSSRYEDLAEDAVMRPWQRVAEEFLALFVKLL